MVGWLVGWWSGWLGLVDWVDLVLLGWVGLGWVWFGLVIWFGFVWLVVWLFGCLVG